MGRATLSILSLYTALFLGQMDCPPQDLEGARISFFHHRSHVQITFKETMCRLFET